VYMDVVPDDSVKTDYDIETMLVENNSPLLNIFKELDGPMYKDNR